jgi:AP endonuclease-2
MESPLSIDGEDYSIQEMMNPPGMFKGGQRLQQWSNKDLLPFSGRLLPEFDRRRSIKDMFRKQTSTKVETLIVPQVPAENLLETVTHQVLVDEPKKAFHKPVIPESPKQSKPPSPSPKAASPRRVASDSHLPPSSKRRKTSGTTKDTNGTSNTQKSLMSFFQPKQPKSEVTSPPCCPTPDFESPLKSLTTSATLASPSNKHRSTEQEADLESVEYQQAIYDDLAKSKRDAELHTPFTPESFIDPSDTKVEWTKIFSKRDAPRCEGHKEPCISLETKKKGPNCGRRFWICPR